MRHPELQEFIACVRERRSLVGYLTTVETREQERASAAVAAAVDEANARLPPDLAAMMRGRP